VHFSPSINIVRDTDKEFYYIPTPNAQNVFNQIINDYKVGIHSFSIIGSYGTGKSAFLVALTQNLKDKATYFGKLNGQFGDKKKFHFLHIVGKPQSFLHTLGEELGLKKDEISAKNVLKALEKLHQKVQAKNGIVWIMVDEFGKFLEKAANNQSEEELYFIQQLAEFVNDEEKSIVFLNTLHQSFNTYASKLNRQQQNEWEKVSGRLKGITFNEPVEQLLYLAANYLKGSIKKHIVEKSAFEQLNELFDKTNAVPVSSEISQQITQELLPFDLLSATVLTLSLQKYGQNERSLFTFLQSNDLYSLQNYEQEKNPFYNVACVYDYLQYNHYHTIASKNNPHYAQWGAIRDAIERIDGSFKTHSLEAIKLIKTIGLLNIFASRAAKLDDDFLVAYAQLALGIDNVSVLIEKLERQKIIRFAKYRNQYILFDGTDIDIDEELLNASNKVPIVEDIITPLQSYFSFPYLPAKAEQYQKGTPRFFEFRLSNAPLRKDEQPKGAIDGFINLLFSKNLTDEEVIKQSQNTQGAILYGYFNNVAAIKEIIFEIKKTEYVLTQETVSEDRIARRELTNLKNYEVEQLNEAVFKQLFSTSKNVQWIFKGKRLSISNRTQFNKQLSKICKKVYEATPIFKNELVNREKISGSIATARKKYFKALTQHWQKENLGFSDTAFPPEKTIYLTLLKETGIHQQGVNNLYLLRKPTDVSYNELWKLGIDFLESAKTMKKGISEFENKLKKTPFKLKQGFIHFWMPTFLFIKRNDFALFQNNRFVPFLTHEVIDLIYRVPNEFKIKSFNVEGIRLDLFNKYRELLNQKTTEELNHQGFIETIRPFLTFYKELPEYTKKTKRLGKSALQLREAIANAKDPEQTFFEKFPKALGYHSLEFLKESDESLAAYVHQLQASIRELRTCYEELINRIEACFLKDLGYTNMDFASYKKVLKKRYKSIKTHLLLPHQRIFFARLTAPLEDKNSWIGSIVSVLLKKNLNQLRDEEEELLLDKFAATFRELDNLCDLHELDIDDTKEEILKIDITTLDTGTKAHQLRLSKQKSKRVNALIHEIEKSLDKDKVVNQAVLIKLLQKHIN
ncbi:MAG: hypothetical protein ACPGVB_11735, partial [Chitinophagales bacterium]